MTTRTFSRVATWCATAAVSGALVFGVAGATGAAGAATPRVAPTATVKIQNYLYMPKTLKIVAGTKVTWTNSDGTGHTVTFKQFGSPILGTGKKYTHVFTTAGTFKYHCSLHPEMTAKVVVGAAG